MNRESLRSALRGLPEGSKLLANKDGELDVFDVKGERLGWLDTMSGTEGEVTFKSCRPPPGPMRLLETWLEEHTVDSAICQPLLAIRKALEAVHARAGCGGAKCEICPVLQ